MTATTRPRRRTRGEGILYSILHNGCLTGEAAMTCVTVLRRRRRRLGEALYYRGEAETRRSLPFGTARTLVAPWVAGIAVADTGVGAIGCSVETHPIVRVPTLDPLDVAGDLTQHRAAPRDLGPDHSTIS
jgi:hypothetical protein